MKLLLWLHWNHILLCKGKSPFYIITLSLKIMNYLFILLDQWQFCPLGDIWQYLEIFSILVVTIGEMLLAPRQGCKTSYNAQGCPTWQRIICYKVSIMLRLGNLNLDRSTLGKDNHSRYLEWTYTPYLDRNWQAFPKIHLEMQGTQNSQNKLEKKNKVGHILLDFKAYKSYKTITYWHKGRHIHQ